MAAPVPVTIVGSVPTNLLAPLAGVFYPAANAQGGGTLCLSEGAGSEAALIAARMPFVIPEKTGPGVGEQPDVGYTIEAPIIAAENPYFRRVLFTSPDGMGQLTAMTLQPNESIGLEAHPSAVQVIMVQEGSGTARVGNQLYHVAPGALIIVPSNVLHDVVNTSPGEPLRVLIFYTAPLHEPGMVEPCKDSEQLAREAEERRVATAAPIMWGQPSVGAIL